MSPQTAYQWGQLILIVLSVLSVLGGIFMKFVFPHVRSWYQPKLEKVTKLFLVPAQLSEMKAASDERDKALKQIQQDVAMMNSVNRARADANPHEANFEANGDGLLTWVNRTYLRWVNRELKEVLNHGWINCIHPDDRARVISEWEDAIEDCRTSSLQYRLIDGTLVEATATPIPEGTIPCERWVGVIRKVKEDAARVSHD